MQMKELRLQSDLDAGSGVIVSPDGGPPRSLFFRCKAVEELGTRCDLTFCVKPLQAYRSLMAGASA
jgi:hypothetical protein